MGARRRRLTLAWALALAPASASAAPIGPTTDALPVVPLEASIEEDWAAKLVMGALREAVLRSDEYTVMDGVLPFAALRLQAKCAVNDPRHGVTELGDFSVDEACLKRIGRRLGVKRFLWGHVYSYAKDAAVPLVKVHLWRDGEPDRSLFLTFHPQAVERMAERFYRHLVIPEKTADVRLETLHPVDGELVVDGQQRGPYEPKLELSLFAGEHVIEVRRGGKALVATTVHVALAPGQTQGVTLAPVEPSAGAVVRPPWPPPRADGLTTTSTPARTTWGWVAVGVGAASIGAGVFSSVRLTRLDDELASKSSYVAYREGVVGGDLCDAAAVGFVSPRPGAAAPGQVRERCDQASTYQVLHYVFYGVGAAALGTGAYLLLTAPRGVSASSSRAKTAGVRWQWRPDVDARRWGLGVTARF